MSRSILAINGSTRAASTNTLFIRAIIRLAGERARFTLFPSIADLPHFNPDVDIDPPPAAVVRFRQLVRTHDAVLICTPEYAMGVPGSLKNALDWCVSSSTLSQRPVMVVVASLGGEKALASLLDTLQVIEAVVRPDTTVHIPFARTKVNAEGIVTDDAMRERLERALDALLTP